MGRFDDSPAFLAFRPALNKLTLEADSFVNARFASVV